MMLSTYIHTCFGDCTKTPWLCHLSVCQGACYTLVLHAQSGRRHRSGAARRLQHCSVPPEAAYTPVDRLHAWRRSLQVSSAIKTRQLCRGKSLHDSARTDTQCGRASLQGPSRARVE